MPLRPATLELQAIRINLQQNNLRFGFPTSIFGPRDRVYESHIVDFANIPATHEADDLSTGHETKKAARDHGIASGLSDSLTRDRF